VLNFQIKKHKPFFQGGLVQSTDIFTQKNHYFSGSAIPQIKKEAFKRNVISGRFATGMNFPLKQKLLSVSIFGSQSIKVFQKELTSTTEGDIFLQLGLQIGYRF
jgi:hypothetical protein